MERERVKEIRTVNLMMMMIIYWFAKDLMSSEDPTNHKVLISLNNMLSKTEKEKVLRRFFDTSNTVIHKMKYPTQVVSVELDTNKRYVY